MAQRQAGWNCCGTVRKPGVFHGWLDGVVPLLMAGLKTIIIHDLVSALEHFLYFSTSWESHHLNHIKIWE